MTEEGEWIEQQCKRIENPPKPDSWRSRYGVFRDAVTRLISIAADADTWTPVLPFTTDERITMLSALCWCAWAEGVSTRHVDEVYRSTRHTLRYWEKNLQDGKLA